LGVSADQTVTLPGTTTQDFYVFFIRARDTGICSYKSYTTLAGPSSDSTVDKWRLATYAKNNSAGVTMPYSQKADRIDWLVSTNRPILTASITTSLVSYNLGGVLPVGIFRDGTLVSDTVYNLFIGSFDGSTLIDPTGKSELLVPIIAAIYLKWVTASAPIHVRTAFIRR
jgi:hypothetical protein